jgi:hypothetical protein
MIQIILLFKPVSYHTNWNRYKGSFLIKRFSFARRLADPMMRLGKRLIKERAAND